MLATELIRRFGSILSTDREWRGGREEYEIEARQPETVVPTHHKDGPAPDVNATSLVLVDVDVGRSFVLDPVVVLDLALEGPRGLVRR